MTTFANESAAIISERVEGVVPKAGLILGSGLNDLRDSINQQTVIDYCDLPGFPETNVEGHTGDLIFGHVNSVPVVCLSGRSHLYEGNMTAMLTPVRTLRKLGCEIIAITNAAGSLVSNWNPGDIMLIRDHINFQPGNPLVGVNEDAFGPRFPDLSEAYDKKLRKIFTGCARSTGIHLREGVYIACLGPNFETPAEIKAFQIWGAQAVGMSTVPEVIIARHCGLRVLAVSVLTNLAAGLSSNPLTHEETLTSAKGATINLNQLFLEFFKSFST